MKRVLARHTSVLQAIPITNWNWSQKAFSFPSQNLSLVLVWIIFRNVSVLILVKMVPGSWRDLGKIPARFLPGSRRDFGRRDSRFPPGFLPGFLEGGGIPGGQNLGRIPAGILPGFLAGGGIPGGQNLSRIPAGVLPGFLAGNWISRWECCRHLRRETKFLAVKIFPAAKISGGPVWNLARIRDENHN